MSFDVMDFLEKNAADFQHDLNRDDYLPMRLDAGFGVFSGANTKLFVVDDNSDETRKRVAKEARDYLAKLKYGFVFPAIRQTWYAEFLNREKQPSWRDGIWEEMLYPENEVVDGQELLEPFWAMFSAQWMGDDAPISKTDFGKKLWMRSTSRSHPNFDPEVPSYKTTQMKDGKPVKDDEGVNRKRYLRLAQEVIGRTKEEAELWMKTHNINSDDSGGANPDQVDALDKALLDLRSTLPQKVRKEYGSDKQWMDSVKDVFNGIHNGKDQSAWIETGLMTEEVIEKVKELVKVYPPL